MEWSTYLQFFLALIFVLGLIMAMSWALKRFGFGDGNKGPLARRRRVAMIESTALDSRHRVVLLRRDDVEHLVLVGPNTSQIIQLLLLMTVLSVAPAILMMVTAFTRVVVVLSILRRAIGTNTSPPNV